MPNPIQNRDHFRTFSARTGLFIVGALAATSYASYGRITLDPNGSKKRTGKRKRKGTGY